LFFCQNSVISSTNHPPFCIPGSSFSYKLPPPRFLHQRLSSIPNQCGAAPLHQTHRHLPVLTPHTDRPPSPMHSMHIQFPSQTNEEEIHRHSSMEAARLPRSRGFAFTLTAHSWSHCPTTRCLVTLGPLGGWTKMEIQWKHEKFHSTQWKTKKLKICFERRIMACGTHLNECIFFWARALKNHWSFMNMKRSNIKSEERSEKK